MLLSVQKPNLPKLLTQDHWAGSAHDTSSVSKNRKIKPQLTNFANIDISGGLLIIFMDFSY